MAEPLIFDADDEVLRIIKLKAGLNGRSLDEEIVAILTAGSVLTPQEEAQSAEKKRD